MEYCDFCFGLCFLFGLSYAYKSGVFVFVTMGSVKDVEEAIQMFDDVVSLSC